MSGTLQGANLTTATGTANRSRLPDVLGIAWVLAAGVAVLVPALVHGIYLGPTDILSTVGLTAQHGTVVHNPTLRDQIAVFIPWIDQAWTQVHHGQLPLWNPYTGLGMPLAFSWQSASFGFPTLIGYLVPVQFAFTAGLFVIVVVSGTGAYVFARMLRLGVLASAFVGTVFVLSGPISSQLGWPMASVMSWAGWLFASALLVVRGRRRARSICAFAVVLALAIYAGHPEVTILLLVALGIYLFVVLVQRAPRLGASGPIVRPVVDLIIGSLAGVALAAPLVLPGVQLIRGSVASTTHYGSITTPDHGALQLLFQGFDGLPISGSHWFGSLSYQSTAAYFGVIALALVLVAVGTRWRRPEVSGLAIVSVVMASLVLLPAIPTAVNDLPFAGTAYLTRAFMPMAFGLSVLAGIGLDALVRDHAQARVRRWALGGFALVVVVLIVVWLFGRGHLPPDETRIREASFLWPVVCAVVGLTVLAGLSLKIRKNSGSAQIRAAHVAGGILLACETAFLVAAGAPLWSSSSQGLGPTPAVVSLQKAVGTSLVGLGTESCVASELFDAPELGILPEANDVFQIHQLAIYDPIAPIAYYTVWRKVTGQAGGNSYFEQFCPVVTTVAVAREFGVKYVLESHGTKGPVGSLFVETVGDEELYRIPDAAPATMSSAPTGQPLPPDTANGTPVAVHHPDPGTWSIVTDLTTPQVLRLRITDVPGWHATIDGRPLALQPFSRVMLQARIPPGRHTVVVRYWPTAFTVGLVLAGISVAGLAVALLSDIVRRRRKREAVST